MATATARWSSNRIPHGWVVIVIVVLVAAIYAQFVLKVSHSEHGERSAFLRWRIQLAELDAGVNVWEKYAYPNPPIMAVILKPFHQLAPTLGASLWFGCKAILALASILMVFALLDSSSQSFPWWGKALTIALCLRPIEGDLIHGNVNLLILFLVTASLYAFCQRRDRLAGLLLGLSIACKLTPALFILYFAWKRAWTTLGATLASLVLFTVVPAFAFGWSNNLEYLESWRRHMIAPYAVGVVSSEHKNQSLPGVLHRLLSDEPSFSAYDGDRKVVVETHNLVAWNPAVVQSIILGAMGLFAILGMAFCRTPIARRPHLALMAEFSVVVLGMLLFCERTWKHHGVTLLLPFGVLAYSLADPTLPRRLRWGLGAALFVAAMLIMSTATGIHDADIEARDRIGKLAQVYGAYAWAFLVLLAGVFGVLFRFRFRQGHDESTLPQYDERQKTEWETPCPTNLQEPRRIGRN